MRLVINATPLTGHAFPFERTQRAHLELNEMISSHTHLFNGVD